jgi:hypothetical protein
MGTRPPRKEDRDATLAGLKGFGAFTRGSPDCLRGNPGLIDFHSFRMNRAEDEADGHRPPRQGRGSCEKGAISDLRFEISEVKRGNWRRGSSPSS